MIVLLLAWSLLLFMIDKIQHNMPGEPQKQKAETERKLKAEEEAVKKKKAELVKKEVRAYTARKQKQQRLLQEAVQTTS